MRSFRRIFLRFGKTVREKPTFVPIIGAPSLLSDEKNAGGDRVSSDSVVRFRLTEMENNGNL